MPRLTLCGRRHTSLSSMRACVRVCIPKHMLTWYLSEYLTHFHQTYINNALWDRDERFTFWGQNVKVTVEYSMLETALLAFTTPLGGGVPYSTTWHRVMSIWLFLELLQVRAVPKSKLLWTIGQGSHKPGKPGILKNFCEHVKLREFCTTSGKNCNKKQSIFSSSFKYLCKTAGDLLYCWSWCGMTLDEGHYYIYFLLRQPIEK